MGQIEVSVVIPTYNRADMLRELLETLSRQTMPPNRFEVIVVVDGSRDGTWEMLHELKTPYRLTPLYQENAGTASSVFSSGVSAARNRGAGAATGATLVFMDDDVLPEPRFLEEHARVHRDDLRAVVLGRLLPAQVKGKRGWNIWEERVFQKHYRLMAQGVRPAAGWRLYSANFSVPREVFWELKGFDLRMGHIRGEDVDLGIRLENAGARFHFSPGAAAVHRGFRNFRSWCNSAYILGPRDIALARERGSGALLPGVFGGYWRSPRVVRGIAALSLGRPSVRGALVAGVRNACEVLRFLRMGRLAHYGYSLIYNLQYWQGLSDGFGGRRAFFQEAARHRGAASRAPAKRAVVGRGWSGPTAGGPTRRGGQQPGAGKADR